MIIVWRTPEDIGALEQVGAQPEELADDGMDWRGRVVVKPWGHETEIHRAGVLSIWRLTIAPGCETSMHCHPGKHTVLILEQGQAVLETLNGTYDLTPGEAVHVKRGAFHRTRSALGAVLIEIESPVNKRDLVRIEDRYGRAGQGYERAAV